MDRAVIAYTIVRHSGTTTGHTEFKQGLEEVALHRQSQVDKVKQLGGILFDTYSEARDWAMKEQYPEDYSGLIPKAPGSFTRSFTVHDLPLYLPTQTAGAIIGEDASGVGWPE
jgi:hypothetical protein